MTRLTISHTLSTLASIAPASRRYDKKDAKQLFLQGEKFEFSRRFYTIKTKHIGMGVYDVWADWLP